MAQLKYELVKAFLLDEARRPESVGRMPSVRQLMSRFHVSLATVNRALAELENERVIIRRPGVGITVNRNPLAVDGVEAGAAGSDAPTIVLAYTDYPDEGIWRKIYTMERSCCQQGVRVVICKLNRETRAEAIIEFIRAQPVCNGLILKFGADMLTAAEVKALAALKIPVVIYESSSFYRGAPENVYRLLPDPEDRARLMIDTLLRHGHRQLGYLRGEPWVEVSGITQKYAVRYLKQHGITMGPERIFSTNINPWENSMDAVQQLLQRNFTAIRAAGLTALIVSSSSCAVAALQTLTELGFRVPGEISLISEGERSICRFVLPRITVVESDFDAMSELAVAIAAGRKKPRKRLILFPLRLIERQSIVDLNPKCS